MNLISMLVVSMVADLLVVYVVWYMLSRSENKPHEIHQDEHDYKIIF